MVTGDMRNVYLRPGGNSNLKRKLGNLAKAIAFANSSAAVHATIRKRGLNYPLSRKARPQNDECTRAIV